MARFLFLALTLVLASTRLVAQTTTASIVGTVRDASGGVIPNASIKAKAVATNQTREVTTDPDGNYISTKNPARPAAKSSASLQCPSPPLSPAATPPPCHPPPGSNVPAAASNPPPPPSAVRSSATPPPTRPGNTRTLPSPTLPPPHAPPATAAIRLPPPQRSSQIAVRTLVAQATISASRG